MREPIDFVITWVDGNDPEWQAKKRSVLGARQTGSADDAREERYRDWGTLRFLFRSIAAFAPWVHSVFLVTDGQCPKWLDLSCRKIRLVRHDEFMSEEDLPTFNSNAIEVGLHRIPGLSEQFVYFNDDMLLGRTVNPEDFFVKGKPVDMLSLQPVIANPRNEVMSRILLNDSLVIARHFDKWETMRAHPDAYFHPGYSPFYLGYNILERVFPQYTGFYTVHGPSPLLKSTFEELWSLEEEILSRTSAARVRSGEDVTQYLFREWQKQKGEFVPRNILKDSGYFEISDDNRLLKETLLRRKKKFICINDPSGTALDFPAVRKKLHRILRAAFSEKSEFEI